MKFARRGSFFANVAMRRTPYYATRPHPSDPYMAILKLPTPVGELTLVASETALMAVHFPTSRHLDVPPLHVVESGSGAEVPLVERGDEGVGSATAVLA